MKVLWFSLPACLILAAEGINTAARKEKGGAPELENEQYEILELQHLRKGKNKGLVSKKSCNFSVRQNHSFIKQLGFANVETEIQLNLE